MSRWAYLRNPETGDVATVARHREGGTYALFGTDRAELDITYNYTALIDAAMDGAHYRAVLDGRRAGEAIPILERAVARLGTARSGDYWEKTPGNAGYALSILLAWAREHPDCVFDIGG